MKALRFTGSYRFTGRTGSDAHVSKGQPHAGQWAPTGRAGEYEHATSGERLQVERVVGGFRVTHTDRSGAPLHLHAGLGAKAAEDVLASHGLTGVRLPRGQAGKTAAKGEAPVVKAPAPRAPKAAPKPTRAPVAPKAPKTPTAAKAPAAARAPRAPKTPKAPKASTEPTTASRTLTAEEQARRTEALAPYAMATPHAPQRALDHLMAPVLRDWYPGDVAHAPSLGHIQPIIKEVARVIGDTSLPVSQREQYLTLAGAMVRDRIHATMGTDYAHVARLRAVANAPDAERQAAIADVAKSIKGAKAPITTYAEALAHAQARYDKALARDTVPVLTQLRELGGVPLDLTRHVPGGPAQPASTIAKAERGMQIMRDVARTLPRDWIVDSNGARPILEMGINPKMLTGGKGHVASFIRYMRRDRVGAISAHAAIFFRSGASITSLSETVAHEFMHRVEDVRPRITEMEGAFFARRTANSPTTLFNGRTPIKADQFMHSYMGKEYRMPTGHRFYELLTTGMETQATKTAGRRLDFLRDPDTHAWFLGMYAAA